MTMSDTMREKCALSVCTKQDHSGCLKFAKPCRSSLRATDAILDTLMTPTEEMEDVGYNSAALMNETPGTSILEDFDIKAGWQAMLQHIKDGGQ